VRVAADQRFDLAVVGHHAGGDATVDALDGAGLQLLHQVGLRQQRFGYHHQAGGVFVQSVHNARAGNVRELRVAVQQAVQQGARPVARRRVYHQAGGFVHHQDVFVFVDDGEVYRLGGVGQRLGLRNHFHGDDFAAQQLGLARLLFAVQQDLAVLDPLRDAAARVVRQQARQGRVQAFAGKIVGYGELLRLSAGLAFAGAPAAYAPGVAGKGGQHMHGKRHAAAMACESLARVDK